MARAYARWHKVRTLDYREARGRARRDQPREGPFVVAVSPTQLTTTVGTPVSLRFGFDGTGYSVSWDVGESSDFGTFILPSECDGGLGPMRGPWTPPPAPNPDGVHTESHTFATAGPYHVGVEVFVACLEQQLPGTRQLDFTIVVAPKAAATTTTAG